MIEINGQWIMKGAAPGSADCLSNVEQLIALVEDIGFIPLFANTVPGFSVEEHTDGASWWTGDESRDPWEWRRTALQSGKLAYGKFFDKKAGFISLAMLPYFVNWRRDGYDFDSRWDEGLASIREKKLMDAVMLSPGSFSKYIKEQAGFGKNGEKNFEGILTGLEMQSYIVIQDFRCRTNRKGLEYGWHLAVLNTPEAVFGRDYVRSAYTEAPELSKERFYTRLRKLYPGTEEKLMQAILR